MKKLLSFAMVLTLIFTLPLTTFAASDVDVTGHIGTNGSPTIDPGENTDDPDSDYDLTFSSGVHWWVTQTSYPNVVNGDATGPVSGFLNKIINNSAADIKVGFVSFALANTDASTVASALELYLTDDLAGDGMGTNDLANGYNTALSYSACLAANGTWEYGFDGQFHAANVNTSYTPQYSMTLSFGF